MNKFDIKLGGAVAIATFVATVIAPAGLADTTVDTTNNGAFSNNTVTVNNSHNTTVNQTNNSTVINTVSVKQNTGKNTAAFNTGGGTTVVSGDATSTVNVQVGGPSNTATSFGCNTCASNTTVNTTNNGAFANTTVSVKNTSSKSVKQVNNQVVVNEVSVKQNTGKNKAKFNTGGGTGVGTGSTTSTVTVNVSGPANTNTILP